MSFTVRLATDLVALEAGSTTPVAIEVANKGETSDQYELQIEGVDPEWTATPVPVFEVDAKDTHAEKVFFKPPRSSESRAGNYPFVVRVRSLESGEAKVVQGMLQIKPYHHLSVDMAPRKGVVSPFKPAAPFEVTVINLGNGEHTVQLFASEPDDKVAFAFVPERVTVAPGQQITSRLSASGARRSFLSNTRLYGVSVTARSTSVPTVMSSVQAQIEQRGLLSPTAFVLLLLAAVLATAWVLFLPKPPQVVAFELGASQIVMGEEASVTWSVANAGGMRLSLDGQPLYRTTETQGTYRWTPEAPGTFRVAITATTAQAQSSPKTLDLIVTPKVAAPMPVIDAFDITPKSVRVGQPLVVRYRFNEAVTKAVLSPPGETLNLSINEIELIPQRTGRIDYRVVVENADGVKAEKTVTVQVVEGSDATILAFAASPPRVTDTDGRVTISWHVASAERVEIDDGTGPVQVESQGGRDFVITRDTTFRLIGYDARSRTVERRVVVRVMRTEPAPEPGAQPAEGAKAGPTEDAAGARY